MKKKICLTLAILCLLTFGCVPTPEVEIVVNKGDHVAENVINETKAPAQPTPQGSADVEDAETSEPFENGTGTFTTPERWTDEIKTNYITVKIDAEILTSGQAVFPVRTVKRTGFTKEMIQPLIDALFPDAIAYRDGLEMTKEDYDEAIRRAVELGKTKRARELNWEKQREAKITDAEFIVTDRIECTDEPFQITMLTAEGQKMIASVYNSLLFLKRRNTGIVYSKEDVEDGVLFLADVEDGEEPEETGTVVPSISLEEAKVRAEAFLHDVNIEGFALCKQEEACYFDLKGGAVWSMGWHLQYVRNYEYYPLNVKDYDGTASGFFQFNDTISYNAGMGNESLDIYVSDQGVEYFAWAYPYIVEAVVNENVRLMPFDEMQEIIKRSISVGVSYLNDKAGYSLRIDQLILTLSVQRVRNEKELAYLMPTWVCMVGVYSSGFQNYHGVVAYGFNAIDGTRVKMMDWLD